MTSKPYNERFGLNKPMDEALRTFAALTKEEQAEEYAGSNSAIPEGESEMVVFKGSHIRKVFHRSEWWFSIVDVIAALTDSTNPRRYWSDLKAKVLKEQGFEEVYDEIVQLKLESQDGKYRETDACNVETLFRIIQSIPSAKAEPFKRWLARVAFERLQEIQNPEIAIKRAIVEYQLQGRPLDWIEQRIRSIMVRKELTSEWKKRGVSEKDEFAILTGVLSTRTFGVSPTQHKELKRLERKHSLRDHMTDLELILTQLAEKSTKEIAQIRDAQGFAENKETARVGGDIAGNARRSLEKETGRRVVSDSNFLPKREKREELEG